MSPANAEGPPTAAPLRPGTVLGKYEILEWLAEGGMAEIYRARAPGLEGFEKIVALKRILPQFAQDDARIAMFLKEARLAATLHHPNIVQVFEVGLCTHGYFFTMELVDGVDVRSLLRKMRGPLPLAHAMAIAIDTAAGLHNAHSQIGQDGPLSIVHRDVSHSNILVSYDGCVKVVDFGIAKAVSEGQDTRTHTLKGKCSFMSPEQCRGAQLDRRSDVFSLGVVLYEMTVGGKLFGEANDFVIMSRIVNEDVPLPSLRRSDYPPDLERIVLKALRRDPVERFQTAQELQLALEELVRHHRIDVSRVSLGNFVREQSPPVPRLHRATAARASTVDATSAPAGWTEPVDPIKPAMRSDVSRTTPRRSYRRHVTAIAGVLVVGVVAILASGLLSSAAVPRAPESVPVATESVPSAAEPTPSKPRRSEDLADDVARAAPPLPTAQPPKEAAATPKRRASRLRSPAVKKPTPSAPTSPAVAAPKSPEPIAPKPPEPIAPKPTPKRDPDSWYAP